MEADLLDTLEALGYEGPLLEEEALKKAVERGLSSPEFSQACSWLCSQIKLLCDLEESITAIAEGDDIASLQLEISGFLKEMQCPYPSLVSGDLKDRLTKSEDCLKLLLFLSTELQALQISKNKRPADTPKSNTALLEAQAISDILGLPKDASADMQSLLAKVETKIKELLAKVKKNYLGTPLLKTELNEEQTARLEKINAVLSSEYECRRRMLVKRLDVSVQSFGWSDRATAKTDEIARAYQPKRYALSLKTAVTLANLFAAREDLSSIIRTSSGTTREKSACAINKVLMGRVPDRGGRPSEIEAPAPEMPPWQKRQDGGGRGWW